MLWIVVFLELPVVAELELLCRFLQVFIEDLDVFLLSQEFLDACMIPLHDVCMTYMICIWQKKEEDYNPMSTVTSIKHDAGNIMLCGCFSSLDTGSPVMGRGIPMT